MFRHVQTPLRPLRPLISNLPEADGSGRGVRDSRLASARLWALGRLHGTREVAIQVDCRCILNRVSATQTGLADVHEPPPPYMPPEPLPASPLEHPPAAQGAQASSGSVRFALCGPVRPKGFRSGGPRCSVPVKFEKTSLWVRAHVRVHIPLLKGGVAYLGRAWQPCYCHADEAGRYR